MRATLQGVTQMGKSRPGATALRPPDQRVARDDHPQLWDQPADQHDWKLL